MDEIDLVLAECTAIENDFWSSTGFKFAPPPAPFKRAAILCRKAHDQSGEIAICERWMVMEKTYSEQAMVKAGKVANVAAGPVARHIRERLQKLRKRGY